MLVDQSSVLDYIPQKPPMVIVEGMLENDETTTISTLQLSPQNIFCQNGTFTESGLLENMAQTAALRSGYEAKQNGLIPKTGFIGALKKVIIHQLPKDNAHLQTRITVLHELLNAMVVKGEVFDEGKLMAEGEMNIFLQE